MRLEMVGHGIWRLRETREGAKKGVSAGFVQVPTRCQNVKKGYRGLFAENWVDWRVKGGQPST